ncbi:cobalt-precorrin-6A reductase [Sphingomonas mollis]|uniref:Cobalt-precorrin-6A reductase n=1 Tax=Sphingomonas mollis TaxID=2795726 RepID=A0ABS0XNV5_9SPHN|nr:cobalt-precorrin-6A reductase [Sphingomonas sp. BT553]MBJ6121721.1 cobalt-precorrin-6A reductase [Sphingomonas sp. BT553]
MPHILILGGTTEASALANALADRAIPATLSYAGRTTAPRGQPMAIRIGGFGGVAGLVGYLRDNEVTHLVDATHPFAAQMSAHAVAAAADIRVPMIALTRPAWQPIAGDRWSQVADIAGAVAALDRPPCRVLLALGRMHVDAFAVQPRHHYLLRFVDAPDVPPPLPHHHLVIDRGPFTVDSDRRLMEEHGIDLIVSKNAGGTGAAAKLTAARQLGLPVVMIDRPILPVRHEVNSVAAVLDWLGHDADRGV